MHRIKYTCLHPTNIVTCTLMCIGLSLNSTYKARTLLYGSTSTQDLEKSSACTNAANNCLCWQTFSEIHAPSHAPSHRFPMVNQHKLILKDKCDIMFNNCDIIKSYNENCQLKKKKKTHDIAKFRAHKVLFSNKRPKSKQKTGNFSTTK